MLHCSASAQLFCCAILYRSAALFCSPLALPFRCPRGAPRKSACCAVMHCSLVLFCRASIMLLCCASRMLFCRCFSVPVCGVSQRCYMVAALCSCITQWLCNAILQCCVILFCNDEAVQFSKPSPGVLISANAMLFCIVCQWLFSNVRQYYSVLRLQSSSNVLPAALCYSTLRCRSAVHPQCCSSVFGSSFLHGCSGVLCSASS